jgi:hypothetical protein
LYICTITKKGQRYENNICKINREIHKQGLG